jgi:putative membrane protein
MNLLLKWLITASAVIFSSYLINGVTVASFWTALWIAIFLGLINVTIKPLLVLLTLPINILTLGLFIFVINALMILLASSVIKGFRVDSFLTALLFSIVLTIVSYFLNLLFGTKKI